ncbi:MAG: phospholipase D-like domain-containing protein [Simkaniaceae bacterium]|nr:phospholipase D-like domain-containing protein [Simkaniaceae bacterium]
MKRSSLALALLFSLLWIYTNYFKVVSPEHPIQVYSTEKKHDLKKVVLFYLKSARSSIDLTLFSLTDPETIKLLNKKAEKIPITLTYDAKNSPNLKKILHPNIQLTPIKSRALMHRKLMIIDKHITLIGSTNLTLSSLVIHDNLLMAIHSEAFATGICLERPFSTPLKEHLLTLYPLPNACALKHLIALLDGAEATIKLDMFTLTHPKLIDALLRAHARGVKLTINLDQSSKRYTKKLEKLVTFKRSHALYHHKRVEIDGKILVIGSANWTKAAFTKNADHLLIVSPQTQLHL